MTIILTWAVVVVAVVTYFVYRRRIDHELVEELKLQEVRDRFAQTRRRLMRLVHEEQLDAESITFQLAYLVSSLLVRRSDSYADFAGYFRLMQSYGLRHDAPELGALRREMKQWTPDVREMWLGFAEAIQFMVRIYSWQVRLLEWVRSNYDRERARWFERSSRRALIAKFVLSSLIRLGLVEIEALDLWRMSRDTVRWSRGYAEDSLAAAS